MKKLNTAQRVEILLKEGVDQPDNWYGIKEFQQSAGSGGDFWEAENNRLYRHHVAETEFLLDIIRELREQVLVLEENPYVKYKKED